jgi:hypothetical protein
MSKIDKGYAVTLIFLCMLVRAQTPDTLWTKTYGSVFDDRAWSVHVTSDSGYIIGGYTYVAGGGGYNFYLVKTDQYGDSLWTKTYGGPSSDYGRSVRQTDDGGYIMVGYSYSFGGPEPDVYVVKTDSLGTMLWDKAYGDTLYDIGGDIQQTLDGGYIIAGCTSPAVNWNQDLWLLKLDSLADTLWTRIYGTIGTDVGSAVLETSDSGYAVTGMNGTGAAHSLWILKTDRYGNLLWSKVYSLGTSSAGQSIHETSDGGFVIGGNVFLAEFDFLLLKTDSLGDTLWTRTYGGQAGEDAYGLLETPDGGYVIVGRTESFGAGWEDIYVVRTDSIGDTLWTRTYGGTQFDYATSIDLTPDGGYVIAGSTESFGAGDHDVWLLRIEPDPYGIEEHECSRYVFGYVEIQPNPFRDELQIRFTTQDSRSMEQELRNSNFEMRKHTLKIYDVSGRLVRSFDLESCIMDPASTISWDGADANNRRLPSGVYFVRLKAGDRSVVEKAIMMR